MPVISYREALRDTLREEMQRDDSVFLIGEEIGVFEGSYKITAGLLAEFGEKRVRDTPIAEEGFVGAAVGAAMLGLRPVVEIMTINFSLLALDQIVNHAAKIYGMFGGQTSVPMVIRTPGGGGQQLGATHSQNIELYYAFVPGLKVVAPSTPADARALMRAAIRDDDPVLFLENLALYNVKGEVPADLAPAEIGKAAVRRVGSDITLIGYSRMAAVATQVARRLHDDDGIDAEVIDLRSLRPLDRDTLVESVARRDAPSSPRTTGSPTASAPRSRHPSRTVPSTTSMPPCAASRPRKCRCPMPNRSEQAALPSAESLYSAARETLAAVGRL